jgi:hypothetical protein
MPRKKAERPKLCLYDAEHIGELLKGIRESRDIILDAIAKHCEIDISAISNLESRGVHKKTRTAPCYIKALHSPNVSPLYLEGKDDLLLNLYQASKDNLKRQCDFSIVSLDYIKSEDKHRKLTELLQLLEAQERPAFIMDGLWFIHAMNGAVLRLFNIDSDSEFLHNWEGWHVVASKFYPNSPIFRAHYNPDEYFPPTITAFFEAGPTSKLFFTYQMRQLVCRIVALSEAQGLKFQGWWRRAVRLDLDYELKKLTRTIIYKSSNIQTDAHIVASPDIEIEQGYTASYRLAVWNPIGTDALEAYKDIISAPNSREIYFAADYQERSGQKFHVNEWPEVQAEMESWDCE